MNSNMEKIELLQNAKEAGYLESKLAPIFNQIETEILTRLKGQFRNSAISEVDLKVSIGMLCSMDDIRNRILQNVNKGKSLEKEMSYGNE